MCIPIVICHEKRIEASKNELLFFWSSMCNEDGYSLSNGLVKKIQKKFLVTEKEPHQTHENVSKCIGDNIFQ